MLYTDGIHLIAETTEELLQYGKWLGLKKEWLQRSKHGGIIYFDIFGHKRAVVMADDRVIKVQPQDLVMTYYNECNCK
jgi:hypothetical protein